MYEVRDSGISPPALENKPYLHGWMQEYLTAFYTLNNTRSYGFGPNPISLTEMLSYIQIYGCSCMDSLVEYVMKMDEAFLKVKLEKEQTKNRDKGESNGR